MHKENSRNAIACQHCRSLWCSGIWSFMLVKKQISLGRKNYTHQRASHLSIIYHSLLIILGILQAFYRQKLFFPQALKAGSQKIVYSFYYVKKTKRFVILSSDKSSERNLSCFFCHDKTQEDRESTESINYLFRSGLQL